MERLTRIAAASLIVGGGVVHYRLWRDGYRGIDVIGPLFVANVVLSSVLALAVVVRGSRTVALAGIPFSLGTIVSLILSRTTGLFGFVERAWTPDAVRATTAEIGSVVALALVLLVRGRQMPSLVPARLRTGRPQS